MEQQVVKFAEQLGWLVGTVQAKSDGWLDRQQLTDQVGRIRKGAEELLNELGEKTGSGQARQGRSTAGARETTRKTSGAANRPAAAAAKPSRGPVDAPGKKHRQRPPSVRGAKHSDERVAKSELAHRAQRQSRRG